MEEKDKDVISYREKSGGNKWPPIGPRRAFSYAPMAPLAEDRFCPPNRPTGKPPRRWVPVRRKPHERGLRPCIWSFTGQNHFDDDVMRLLIAWSVRWVRGNGLPLGYRDPYDPQWSASDDQAAA